MLKYKNSYLWFQCICLKYIYCFVAATSLLKWAREEGNPALRSMVEKLYDITLMSATVQKQYAEQASSNYIVLNLLFMMPYSYIFHSFYMVT